jgi:hypothetical protein
MLGIHRVSTLVETRDIGGSFAGAAGLLITVGIDVLIDGILIGVTLLTEAATGILIAGALAISVLFLGGAGVVALPPGVTTLGKLAVPAALGLLPTIGVTVGVLMLDGNRDPNRVAPRVRVRGPAVSRHSPDATEAPVRRRPRRNRLKRTDVVLVDEPHRRI